jgi:hypothetical protein
VGSFALIRFATELRDAEPVERQENQAPNFTIEDTDGGHAVAYPRSASGL